MIDNNSDIIIKELIRLVFVKFSQKGKMSLSKRQILKILYQVKMELPEDNIIKNKLAYYWYKNGPFSKVLYDNFTDMEDNQIHRVDNSPLEIYKYSNDHLRTPLIDIADDITDDLVEARIILSKKIDQFINMNNLINDIYSKYAPTPFYLTYNINFRNKFDNFCNYILDDNKSLSKNRYKKTEIDDSLTDAVITLHNTKLFFQFRCIFNDFTKALYELLEVKSTYTETEKELLSNAKTLHSDIWDVFSYGIRIEEHDEYYNKYKKSWNDKYLEEINKLEKDVNIFSNLVFENIQNKIKFNPELDKRLQLTDTQHLKRYTTDEYLEYIQKITQ